MLLTSFFAACLLSVAAAVLLEPVIEKLRFRILIWVGEVTDFSVTDYFFYTRHIDKCESFRICVDTEIVFDLVCGVFCTLQIVQVVLLAVGTLGLKYAVTKLLRMADDVSLFFVTDTSEQASFCNIVICI